MRKILIAIIIIAMLFTTVFSTIQLNIAAEEGPSSPATSVATGANANTAGNKITPGSLTTQYQAEGDWTAAATWAELTAALKAGNKKIYLTANIPNATNYNAKTSSNGDQLDGAIIDGNGYTITAAVPLFQHTKNTTFQNLTLNSTFSATAGYCALAYWETAGYTKMYNVTANVTATYASNSSGSQQFSALVIYAQSGSEFENVVVNATIDMTSTSIAKANSVGLLAARAEGTIRNCIATGSIKVGGTAFDSCDKDYNGVGGLVGQASNVTFENCTNNATIEVTAPGNAKNRRIGGIAGFSTGTNSYTNCINNGDITVTYTNDAIALTEASGAVTDTNAQQTGGLIGYMGTATTITKCENRGDVTLTATASGTITAPADNATAASYTLVTYGGGVIGYAAAVATFQDVWNSGNVSVINNIDGIAITGAKVTKAQQAYAAGIVGYSSVNFTFNSSATLEYTAKNTGDISSNYYAAGIIGYMTDGGGIDRSVNEGAVTATDIAAGIVAYRKAGNRYDNMNYCSNSGTITLKGKAAVNGEGYVAGLIGYGGYKVTNSTNSGTIVAGKDATNHTGVYAAGIMAYNHNNPKDASSNVLPITITNCTNNGDVICTGLAAGGIVGYTKNNGLSATDCVNNGKITFTSMKTSTWSSAGGILGYGYNSNAGNPPATEFVNISYCVNNGDIVSGIESSGKNEHFGGIVGRVGNPINFQISNCINNGDMSVSLIDGSSGWAGGIIGASQCYGNSEAYTGEVTNCVNTGTMSACNAAALMGRANTGGDGETNFVNNLTANGFVNAGKISGVGKSAFLVAFQDRGDTISTVKYDFDNCVNVGEIHGDGIVSGGIGDNSFATVTMDNCLISGTFTGNGNNKYILAPANNAVTGSGNYYDKNDAGINGASYANGATADADIESKIRGEGSTTVAFDRMGAENAYNYAIEHGGADTSAIAKYVINTCGDSDYTYFTATQAEVDAARKALESSISGGALETTYIVSIDPNVKLAENGGSVDFQINNPKLSSKVTINVTQGGETGDNFKLTCDGRVLEFWFVQGGKVVKQGQNLFEFDGSDDGLFYFGAEIKDEAQLLPGTYTGTVTFNMALSE